MKRYKIIYQDGVSGETPEEALTAFVAAAIAKDGYLLRQFAKVMNVEDNDL